MTEKPKEPRERYFARFDDEIYEMEGPEPEGGYNENSRALRLSSEDAQREYEASKILPYGGEAGKANLDPGIDWGRVGSHAAESAAIGGPMGVGAAKVLGGPAGLAGLALNAGSAGVGGAVESLAEQGAFGSPVGSGWGPFVAGTAADIGSALAGQKGLGLAGVPLNMAEGVARRMWNPRRVVKELGQSGLGGRTVGTTGADRVREIVDKGISKYEAEEKVLWDAWSKALPSGATITGKKFQRGVNDIIEREGGLSFPSELKKIVSREDDFLYTPETIQRTRSQLLAASRKYSKSGEFNEKRLIDLAVSEIEKMERAITTRTRSSGRFLSKTEVNAQAEAAALLRKARYATRQAKEITGKGEVLHKFIKNEVGSGVNNQEFLIAVLKNPGYLEAIRLLRKAAQKAGQPDALERELKLAYIHGLQGTLVGATGEQGAGKASRAMSSKLSQMGEQGESIFGKQAFDQLKFEIIGRLNKLTTGGSRVSKIRADPSSVLTSGAPPAMAMLGGLGGMMTGEGAGAGALAGYLGMQGIGKSANWLAKNFGEPQRLSQKINFIGDPVEREIIRSQSKGTPINPFMEHIMKGVSRQGLGPGLYDSGNIMLDNISPNRNRQ